MGAPSIASQSLGAGIQLGPDPAGSPTVISSPAASVSLASSGTRSQPELHPPNSADTPVGVSDQQPSRSLSSKGVGKGKGDRPKEAWTSWWDDVAPRSPVSATREIREL